MGSLADHIMLAIPGKGSVNEKLIAFFGGGATLQSQSTTQASLILKEVAGQTADLLRFETSAGALLGRMFPYGHFTAQYFGTLSNSTSNFGTGGVIQSLVSINAGTAPAQVVLAIRGSAAQTANLTEWQDSAGAILARLLSGGQFYIAGAAATFGMQDSGGTMIGRVEHNFGGRNDLFKMVTSAPGTPGLNNYANLYFRAGTLIGTLKLCVRAGVAGAETTIFDNIPQ